MLNRKSSIAIVMVILLLSAVLLTGCPKGTSVQTQLRVAKASQDAMATLKEAQKAELQMYALGKIPVEDQRFILEQEKTIGKLDLTLNSCVRTATDTNGWVACLDTGIATLDGLQAEGKLFLKSEQAQLWYVMLVDIGLKTSLNSIKTMIITQKGA